MCLNADIERQFEFVQQAWLGASSFEGLRDETDPLSSRPRKDGCFTIPTPSGPIPIKGMQSYVTMRGGGYFFLPSRRALSFLCNLPVAATPVPASADLKELDAMR
jgi:deferrochelatase/peroxidase EfeB